MALIELKNIYKIFENKKILHNFSLTINKNDKILIYGKSGIGKSTIFKLILGFTLPDKGQILYNNKPINEENIWELRQNISYIPQSVDIGEGKIKSFIKHIMSYKINEKDIGWENQLPNLLEKFHLNTDLLNKNIQNLSGGEKQRIAIIISILLNRNIFLLDEITAQLDKKMKDCIVNYFLNIEKTVLVISHDECWLNKNMRIITLGE